MFIERLTDYFMPPILRNNKSDRRYGEYHTIVSSIVVAMPFLLLFPFFMMWIGQPAIIFIFNPLFLTLTLLSVKHFAHYRIPMSLTAIATYFIIYHYISESGMIFSANMSVLHMYLLGAIWTDKRYGWWAIFTNLIIIFIIYQQSVDLQIPALSGNLSTSPLYSLGLHSLITIFFGGFLAYQQIDQERSRRQVLALQNDKIMLLDETVRLRTNQLNNMRQVMAADFHDYTGNLLSAITRQAGTLELMLRHDSKALPVVTNIIQNSNELYASSKDFLWNLNHNSDDPYELFAYLKQYGQQFYNQFDIAFSSAGSASGSYIGQLDPFAALNLIFIFKEAMTNVVRHAGADEVLIYMESEAGYLVYGITDNGNWKSYEESGLHFGIANIEKRCEKYGFLLIVLPQTSGTSIKVKIPTDKLEKRISVDA
jgi:signal transduction histidine kinase